MRIRIPEPRTCLAGCLLAAAIPVLALEPLPATEGDTSHHTRQRQLLEAYVDCIRGASRGPDFGPPRAAASVCAAERAAYQATLPPERAAQILETIDAGPAGR
jgi:hypothetical protein